MAKKVENIILILETELKSSFSFPLRCFFYLVTPGETTFESPDDVPDVISMIIPYFVVMIAVEAIVCQFKGRFRINDATTSMSHAMLLRYDFKMTIDRSEHRDAPIAKNGQ